MSRPLWTRLSGSLKSSTNLGPLSSKKQLPPRHKPSQIHPIHSHTHTHAATLTTHPRHSPSTTHSTQYPTTIPSHNPFHSATQITKTFQTTLRSFGPKSTTILLAAPAAIATGTSPVATYDMARDLGLDKVKLPPFGQDVLKQNAKEKTLDEWLEADAVLKLNQIRRRATLEQEASKQVKKSMSYHDRKVLELGIEGTDYTPGGERSFADSMQDDLYRTTSAAAGVSDGLTAEESKALEKWMRDRDAHHVVINYLCDDIANYFKSFLVDNLADVIDDALIYLPKLIPHYFITPVFLNFLWALFPKNPLPILDPRQLIPTKITSCLKFVSNTIRSNNILVDLRVFYNLFIVSVSSGSYFLYELTSKCPQIYNYFGYYITYPFAWFLHHYGDSQLAVHIIKASMNHEERVRMKNYYAKHGGSPESSTRQYPSLHPISKNVVEGVSNFISHYWNHSDPDVPHEKQPTISIGGLPAVGPRGPGGALDQARRHHQSKQPQSFIDPLNPGKRMPNTSPALGNGEDGH